MGFFEQSFWGFFHTSTRSHDQVTSSQPLATPKTTLSAKFSLPLEETYSPSSSTSSPSSSSTFWTSPAPSRRSLAQYIPSSIRNSVSKRQVAVVLCLLLALLIWVIPQPGMWRHQVVHITVQQAVSNPYQVLRPVPQNQLAKKHAPDPSRWLERNSNNMHAENAGLGLWKSVPSFGHFSAKPRAALISLVRNSELQGIMQSMRQLEYQWNHKYNYPWVFFNDESFSDEFKVRGSPFSRSNQI